MTIKTWLQEIHGGKINPQKASTPDGVIEALDYAIETYGSLGKRILKKHKVSWEQTIFLRWYLIDEEKGNYHFDTTNCSLCYLFLSCGNNECFDCPLARIGKGCNHSGYLSPWRLVISERNPKPLLKALKEAKKWFVENQES